MEDGYYWFEAERTDKLSIAEYCDGGWWLINEAGSFTIEEINDRGWQLVGRVNDTPLCLRKVSVQEITHYGLFRPDVPGSPMIKEAAFFQEQRLESKKSDHDTQWYLHWEPICGCSTIGEARRQFAETHGVELSPIYLGEE